MIRIRVQDCCEARFGFRWLAAACVLALGACSQSEDAAPGGVTANEAEALDEAAEMIEQRPREQGAEPAANESVRSPTPAPPQG